MNSSDFIFSHWSLSCLLQASIWTSFPPCQKGSHSISSRSTVGQILAYTAKMKRKLKDRLKLVGLEKLFKGIQSERSCGKFMFQAGSGINPCQHQHDSVSVSPNAKQQKPGTSQPRFSPPLWHSLAQSSISACVVGRIERPIHYLCYQPISNFKTDFNPCQLQQGNSHEIHHVSGLLLLGNLVPPCWCPVQRLGGGGRI